MLDAMLLRPKLILLTEKPSKNDKALDELDFGTVHIDNHRTVRLFLTNITDDQENGDSIMLLFQRSKL